VRQAEYIDRTVEVIGIVAAWGMAYRRYLKWQHLIIPHHQLDQQANQRGCGDAAEPQGHEPKKSGAAAR
jgi:hypothetical protein